MTKTRDEFFGDEVKLRIMLGTYALSAGYYDQYYLKAMKVRALIADDFKQAFADCDVIIHPVAPTTAYKIGEKISDPLAMYLGDIYTVTANLAGIPAISIPCAMGQNGLPIGMQISANHFDELGMIQTAYRLEQLLDADGAWMKNK
jgi:aspartyl-tRNA(Asn)/glutamyl-tRNA(Gln) amidotransferase subunit A